MTHTKKFVAVAAFVFAFAIAAGASAMTWDFGSATIKKGSSGTYASSVQAALNACNGANLTVDGKFGAMSVAAAKAFQASKGLTADGLVGSSTKAALNSCSDSTTTTTTGSLCPNGMTLASNCTALPTTTPTQALCPNGMTLASNCTALPTTGGSVVSGGAGNISSLITLGSPSSTVVSEGDQKKAVLGFEIRADAGSGLALSNVAVQFQKSSGSGSTWINRYVGNIYVMQGSNVIGSIPASALSQNGNLYTANVALTGATVAANQTADLYIAVDGNTTIDSADSGTYVRVDVTSIRYMDGTNAVLTYNPTTTPNQTFTVQKLSQNANVKLQVSEDANNPRNRTITANYSNNTQDVSLLKFNVTATGSPMYFNEIDVNASATGVADLTNVASLYKLSYNGNVISTVNFNTTAGLTSYTLRFGDTATSSPYTATSLNGGSSLVIPAGQTSSFEILADVKPLATEASTGVLGGACGTSAAGPGLLCTSAFNAGDTLKIDLISSLLSSWVVLDQTGNSISTSPINRQGSATGYDQTFRIQGVSATLVGSTVTTTSNNTYATATASVMMNIDVTASGSDFFLPRSIGVATGTGAATSTSVGTDGFLITALDNSYAYDATAAANLSASVGILSNSATIDGASGRIKVSANTTAHLQIVASLNNQSGALTGQKSIQLNAIGAATDGTSSVSAYATLPAYSFQSQTTPAF